MDTVTAYHESGHIVGARLVGGVPLAATIDPDRDDGPRRWGDVEIGWPLKKWSAKELARRQILCVLAGPAAEMIHRQEPLHPAAVPEWGDDWAVAWSLGATLEPNEGRRLRLLENLARDAYQLLWRDEHWAAVAAVVDELSAHERLDREELDDILSTWLR